VACNPAQTESAYGCLTRAYEDTRVATKKLPVDLSSAYGCLTRAYEDTRVATKKLPVDLK